MKIAEVNILLDSLDVCIIRDALKIFGSDSRDCKAQIEKLQDKFQELLIVMSDKN